MGLKVIRQYEAEEGNITYHRQCGTGNPTCSNQDWMFAAYQPDCAGLLSVLSGQPTNGTVERDKTSVCYSAGGRYSARCCISVMKPISNVVDRDYLNFATTLYNQCVDAKSSRVAGYMGFTTKESECNNVCLIGDFDDCIFLMLPHWK
jgi:hypothetical protein